MGAVSRACRSGRPTELAAAAQRVLVAAPNLPVEELVFVLNRIAHAGRFQDPSFWRAAADVMTPRISELRSDVLGLAANAFSRAGVPVPQLMQVVSRRLLDDLASVPVSGQTLALNAVRAAARVHNDRDASSKDLGVLEMHLAGRLTEMNSQDAALFLSEIGSGGDTVGNSHALLQKVKGNGLASLAELPPPAIAQLLQAFARLEARDKEVLNGLKPLVLSQLQRFPPQSLGMVANAYARLRALDERLLKAIADSAACDLEAEAVCGSPTGKQPPYDHIAVTQLLNSHAKVSIFDKNFFERALDWMTANQLKTFNAQSLANALHAYAKFHARYSSQRDRLQLWAVFATFVPEILSRLEDFTIQNLVNTIYAFSLLGFREPQLLAEALRSLVARRAAWKPQDVANLASAMARLEHFDAIAFSALASSVPTLVARFRSDELASVLNALAHYVRRGGPCGELSSEMQGAFEAAAHHLQQRPSCLAEQPSLDVALISNAFAKVSSQGSAKESLRRACEGAAVASLHALDCGKRTEALSLVVVTHVFSSSARLRRAVPSRLAHASLALLPESLGEGESWRDLRLGLDPIRTASMLSSLVQLNTRRGDLMWPWCGALLASLATESEAAVVKDLGNHTRVTAHASREGMWSDQTLLVALSAVSMLDCTCGYTWWRALHFLLSQLVKQLPGLNLRLSRDTAQQSATETAHAMITTLTEDGPGIESLAVRQARHCMLVLFQLHLRPCRQQHPRQLLRGKDDWRRPPLNIVRMCGAVDSYVNCASSHTGANPNPVGESLAWTSGPLDLPLIGSKAAAGLTAGHLDEFGPSVGQVLADLGLPLQPLDVCGTYGIAVMQPARLDRRLHL